MAIIRPSADLITGWSSTGAALYTEVDETTASDTDNISASSAGQIARVQLGATTDPGNDNDHVLRYRATGDGDRGLIVRVLETGQAPGIVTSKQPWRSQPQVPVGIDWNNPLTRRLRVAINPGSKTPPVDSTGRKMVWNAAPSQATCRFGLMHQGNGSTAYATLANSPELDAPSALTCFSIWLGDPSGDYYGGDNARIIMAGKSWKYGRYSAVGGSGSGNLTKQVFTLTGIADYLEATYSIASRIETSVAVSINGTSLKFYRSGGLVESKTISASRSQTGSNLVYMAASGITEVWKDSALIALVWDRELSGAEIASLSDNPWQIFKPRQRISYFDAPKLIATQTKTAGEIGAGYGGTIALSSGEAANITDYSKLAVEVAST